MKTDGSSIVVKMRFTFDGKITKKELHDALVRCLRTKQFRLVGRYEIIETYDEVGLEPVSAAESTPPVVQSDASPRPVPPDDDVILEFMTVDYTLK